MAKQAAGKKKSALRETIDVVVWAVVMAFLARSFLARAIPALASCRTRVVRASEVVAAG